jgi:hypothetical protein
MVPNLFIDCCTGFLAFKQVFWGGFSRLIESTNKRGFSYRRTWITNVVLDVYLADVISEMSILHFVVYAALSG